MKYPYISTNFLNGYRDLVQSMGGRPEDYAAAINLQLDTISQRESLIPLNQFAALLDHTKRELKIPDFVLRLGRVQDMTVLGPLALTVGTADSVLKAVASLIQHLQIQVSSIEVTTEVKGDYFAVSLRSSLPNIDNQPAFQDYILAAAFNVLLALCGQRYFPRAVYLPFLADRDLSVYSDYFHCPVAVKTGQLTLLYDRHILDQSIDVNARHLALKIKQANEHKLDEDFIAYVRLIIGQFLATGECSLASIAQALGYSLRTFQRRLAECDTTFSTLLGEVRSAQALRYLEEPHYRLTDIAILLGYANLSAFSRSFYRWFGFYPEEIKKKRRGYSRLI